ncbi:MAG TPA: NADPH-dependent F420 reductase [Methanocorpusculum sp.]|nr:NADPH-dependent F420 reductase [Methanocorpusculum sp.]
MKKVAILGGTGNIGEGLARRICLGEKFDVEIGSRGAEKAAEAAAGVCTCLIEHNCTCTTCTGGTNADVCEADILILSLPFERIESTIETIGKDCFENKIVVSLINPMIRNPQEKYFLPDAPEEGSAALAIRKMLPESAKLVCAFNNVAANKWMLLDEELDYTVAVCGDDEDAKKEVMELVASVSKLQPLDAGPLAMSKVIEGITPLVITIAMRNKLKDVGVYFR